jgi:TRAP-type transport system small permease protein
MDGQTSPKAASPVPATGFGKFVSSLGKIVDPIAKYGGVIGCVALAFMMFMTVVDVFGRYLGGYDIIHKAIGFFRPVPGSLEMTQLLMGILISFGLGYCALKRGHIRVDLVLQYTSKRVTSWFDIFTYGISAVFYALISWQSWLNGIGLYSDNLKTAVLAIPQYPFPFVLTVGAAIVALVLLRDFFKSVEEVTN